MNIYYKNDQKKSANFIFSWSYPYEIKNYVRLHYIRLNILRMRLITLQEQILHIKTTSTHNNPLCNTQHVNIYHT